MDIGSWIRIRIDNTDSDPANSHEIGQAVKMYIFYTDPDPQLFINVSVPTDPILIKKGKN
jgi:hypothetical protein